MGKPKRKVYDFLYALDYGVCHGPVDSVNQVTIKDKRVFCGNATDRVNVHVRMPDLFGGDDAEGGVEGCIEVYVGKADQFMSDEYARRFKDDLGVSRTHLDMPGYRGLCHLFFRGGPGLNKDVYKSFWNLLISLWGYSPTNPSVPESEPANIGDTINQTYADLGFKWTANNPYMPETKVSVTRLPKTIVGANHRIESGAPFDPELVRTYSSEAVVSTFRIAGDIANPLSSLTRFVAYDTANGSLLVPPGSPADSNVVLAPFDVQSIDDGKVSWRMVVDFDYTAENKFDYQLIDIDMTGIRTGYDPSKANPYYLFFTNPVGFPVFGPWKATVDTGQIAWPHHYDALSISAGAQFWGGGTPYVVPRQDIEFTYFPVLTHCTIDGSLEHLPDANPAQIIHELLTNDEWGSGEPLASIDLTSFDAAANTFHLERFGLSFVWVRQSEVDEFIKEVLDHVQAFLYISPSTGLWKLRPLRNDYDPATLRSLNPTNCDLTKYGRRAWGEVINEITVSYTDPNTEEAVTVTSHSPGAIALQGEVVSETRDYHGIRNERLAKAVADRDVAESSYPAFTATAKVMREFWNIEPGDCLKLTWPDEGIAQMIVRVMSVDYGKTKGREDRAITLELIEDVFARERTTFQAPQGSLWQSGNTSPIPLDQQSLMEAPLPVLQLNNITDTDAKYPGGVYVAPFGDHTTLNVTDIALQASDTAAPVVKFPPTRSAALPAPLSPEVHSSLPASLIAFLSLGNEAPGDFYVIGTSDGASEVVMLEALVGSDWTVMRGVWDTVPGTWAAGARIWDMPITADVVDPTEWMIGDSVTYRMLPSIGGQRLAFNSATPITHAVIGRPHLPFRPANVKFTPAGGATDVGFGDLILDPPPASIDITWSNRNRTLEMDNPVTWDSASLAPEAGQTTTVRVYGYGMALLHEYTGIVGTSYTLTVSAGMLTDGTVFVEVLSERAGLESLQSFGRYVHLVQAGYGNNWGNNYGN